MSTLTKRVLEHALSLPPTERATLVDELLASLDRPDSRIDALWAKEAENRIDAYERGDMEAISAEEVLAELDTL